MGESVVGRGWGTKGLNVLRVCSDGVLENGNGRS